MIPDRPVRLALPLKQGASDMVGAGAAAERARPPLWPSSAVVDSALPAFMRVIGLCACVLLGLGLGLASVPSGLRGPKGSAILSAS